MEFYRVISVSVRVRVRVRVRGRVWATFTASMRGVLFE